MALKVPNYNSNKMKGSNIKRPLARQTFYLDLKMYPGEAKLCKNLKMLGAKQESFLTRDVSFVVSNRECLKSAPTFKVPSMLQNWAPLTPITNTTCNSPLFNESSTDYLDSPSNTYSPASDQNAVPMSRGMAMLQKANLKKQAHFNTDVLEFCKKQNVKILHVDNVLARVEKLKSQLSVQFAAEKKRLQNGERKLKPPFLKVEEAKRAWTCYREFPSSTFNNKLSDQVKELYNHFKKSGNIQVAFKPILGEVRKNKSVSSTVQSPAFPQSISKSFSKVSETTAKPSTAFSVCNGKRKISEQPLVASKRQKTSQGKKKKLYCEICKINYVNLDRHLASDSHRIFMSDPMNFLEIQNIITSLPKKEDFLISRSSLCTDTEHTWDVPLGDSSKNAISLDYPQLYSTGCEISAETGSHFYPSQFPASNIFVPAILGEFDTELYSLLGEDYISPSCTSPESAYMPYLEDSIDRNLKENTECGTPLNLSKKENGNFINQLPQSFNQATDFKYSESFFRNEVAEILFTNVIGEGINIDSESSAVLHENLANTEVDPALGNTNVVSCQSKRKMDVEHLSFTPVMTDSQCVSVVESEIIFKDGKEQENTTQLGSIPVECNINTVTSVELCPEENASHTQLLLNDCNQITDVESSKNMLLENSAAESLSIDKIDVNCISTIENPTVPSTIESHQGTDNVQLERVNSNDIELSITEQNAVPEDEISLPHTIQDKVQNTSNDSGIDIQDSYPPSLNVCPSYGEDSAVPPKLNECCALDLSTAKEISPETNFTIKDDQMCLMPELSPNVPVDLPLLYHPLEVSVQGFECMPVLTPVLPENGCEAVSVDIDTCNDSKSFETNVLSDSECETIKQNASPSLCPDNCKNPVEENQECEPSVENSSPNTLMCEPIITDINSSSESRNAKKVTFSQVSEEVPESTSHIRDNLEASSATSCYEVVEEADFDSSSTECEWDNIHSNVDSLCLSLCPEEEDVDL